MSVADSASNDNVSTAAAALDDEAAWIAALAAKYGMAAYQTAPTPVPQIAVSSQATTLIAVRGPSSGLSGYDPNGSRADQPVLDSKRGGYSLAWDAALASFRTPAKP